MTENAKSPSANEWLKRETDTGLDKNHNFSFILSFPFVKIF